MTIYDMKRLSAAKQPYFFDYKTMRFFHQTLRMFKVRRVFLEPASESATKPPVYELSCTSYGPMRARIHTVRFFWIDDLYQTIEAVLEAQRGATK